MYLNVFAQEVVPVDLTPTDEFQSLLLSADELGIRYSLPVRYQSRNVVMHGLRFHALEWGEPHRPSLLLLHGGNQTAHSWDLVSLHLANRFHVVALDQRGHGDSEWPRDCDASFSQMASDAARLMELLELRNPVVVGHSMGGLVTLELLSRFPGIASKAVLVDIGPEVSPEGSKAIGNFVRSVGEYDSIDEFVERVRHYDPYRSPAHIQHTAKYNLLRRVDGKFLSKHDVRRRHLEGVRQALREDWPRVADPSLLDLPLLLVRGADSRVLTEELAKQFVERLPRGELKTVDRAGHNVHSQNTAGFLRAITPFLLESAT